MIVYTSPTCGRCKVLKKKLEDNNIPFTESTDIVPLINKGIQQLPVVDIDGTLYTMSQINTMLNNKEL